MIVFINDVLQVPGLAFKFEGGSLITFTEAPAEAILVRLSSTKVMVIVMLSQLMFLKESRLVMESH